MEKELIQQALLEAADWEKQMTDAERSTMTVTEAKENVIERIYKKYYFLSNTAVISFRNEHGEKKHLDLNKLSGLGFSLSNEVPLLQHLIDKEILFKPEPIILKIEPGYIENSISLPITRRERRKADREAKKKKK